MIFTSFDALQGSAQLPHYPPQRIISLVPSITELLAALDLEHEVVGITKFCEHPYHWKQRKTKVGGTKNVSVAQVKTLHPDLIIANKEENEAEAIRTLAEEFPVWVSDIKTLQDALDMIQYLGELCGKSENAAALLQQISRSFSEYPTRQPRLRAAYFIWNDPLMTVGGDTFISAMMERAGFENIFAPRLRYPEVEINEVVAQQPAVLLFSSEPFPFKEHHTYPFRLMLPNSATLLVDGTYFSWYGSRLLKAAAYFNNIHRLAVQHLS